ncbi:MAG: manganese efflux pump MntP [Saccharofermentanales bacterium]
MELTTLFLLAIGLSMDAFAVSVTNGMCYQGLKKRHAFLIAGTFGFFQALMPLIGYFFGQTFNQAIESFDHWIAFGLLTLIGGHMIFEAIRDFRSPDKSCKNELISYNKIFIQGIATSIDALAVGVSFALIDTDILQAVAVIGLITFFVCITGVLIGKKTGRYLKGRSEIAGGLILIGIGLKILIDHLIN